MERSINNPFKRNKAKPEDAPDWQACRYGFHCRKCKGAKCRNNLYHLQANPPANAEAVDDSA